MKWIIYIVLLAAAAILPREATDVGKLIPMEVVAISEEAGTIYIETDTGDRGRGNTLAEAITNMEETASGVIYLDTAEYLILEKGMEAAVEPLRCYLKDDVRVCVSTQVIKLDGIAKYLDIHKPKLRLREAGETKSMPVITEENGRYSLPGK